MDVDDSTLTNGKNNLPEDFFDSSNSSKKKLIVAPTTSETEKKEPEEEENKVAESKDALPEGFFDDPKLDAKASFNFNIVD